MKVGQSSVDDVEDKGNDVDEASLEATTDYGIDGYKERDEEDKKHKYQDVEDLKKHKYIDTEDDRKQRDRNEGDRKRRERNKDDKKRI